MQSVVRSFGMHKLPALMLFLVSALSAQPPRQPPFKPDPVMAAKVREEFLHAWNGYKQYAWGHDELRPLTKGYRDWHSASLYMTPVDALDTMVLMGLKAEADRTRDLISSKL